MTPPPTRQHLQRLTVPPPASPASPWKPLFTGDSFRSTLRGLREQSRRGGWSLGVEWRSAQRCGTRRAGGVQH